MNYRVSILPTLPEHGKHSDYDCCIAVVPKDYAGIGPMPRYFGGAANIRLGLTRLGVEESRREQIIKDVAAGKSHYIPEIEIREREVAEFWWDVLARTT